MHKALSGGHLGFFLGTALFALATMGGLPNAMGAKEQPNLAVFKPIALPESFRAHGILFTPNSKYLVVFGAIKSDELAESYFISFWNTVSCKFEYTIRKEPGIIDISFTPDGKYMAVASWETGIISIYNIVSETPMAWKERARVDTNRARKLSRVAVSHDGTRVICGICGSQPFLIYDIAKEPPQELPIALEAPDEDDLTIGIRIAKDGRKVLVTRNYSLQIWDLRELRLVQKIQSRDFFFKQGIFSPDERWVVSSSRDKVIVWEAKSLQAVAEFQVHDRMYYDCVSITSDSKYVIATSDTGVLDPAITYVWNRESRQLAYKCTSMKTGCIRQALSSDDKWLALLGGDCKTVVLCDFAQFRSTILERFQ